MRSCRHGLFAGVPRCHGAERAPYAERAPHRSRHSVAFVHERADAIARHRGCKVGRGGYVMVRAVFSVVAVPIAMRSTVSIADDTRTTRQQDGPNVTESTD